MYLLMTIGTGIGTDPTDATERLIRISTYVVCQFKPERVIYLCSEESRNVIPQIEEACRNMHQTPPPPAEICLIDNPTDFTRCFEVIYGMVSLFSDNEVVINASSGTRAMTMAASIVSFMTRTSLTYVTGEKEAGLVIPGTEQMREMTLYSAYDRLQLRQAIGLFNNTHFGSALRQLSGISSTLEEQSIYYGIFSGYWYWDTLDYKKAYEYLSSAPDLHDLIPANREFLRVLLDLDEKDERIYPRKQRMAVRQEKYTYILVDLLNNAGRRIDGERYDDALARLYRVVELLSQVLLLNYGIDDNEEKIQFSDLRKMIRDRKDLSTYARKADRSGIIRIGLRYKFMLLEDLGMHGANRWYSQLQNYLELRNDSILAHGLKPIAGETVRGMWDDVHQVIQEACRDLPLHLEELRMRSQFPQL